MDRRLHRRVPAALRNLEPHLLLDLLFGIAGLGNHGNWYFASLKSAGACCPALVYSVLVRVPITTTVQRRKTRHSWMLRCRAGWRWYMGAADVMKGQRLLQPPTCYVTGFRILASYVPVRRAAQECGPDGGTTARIGVEKLTPFGLGLSLRRGLRTSLQRASVTSSSASISAHAHLHLKPNIEDAGTPPPAAKGCRSRPARPGSCTSFHLRAKPTRRAGHHVHARDVFYMYRASAPGSCAMPQAYRRMSSRSRSACPTTTTESDAQYDQTVSRIAWFFHPAPSSAPRLSRSSMPQRAARTLRQYIADQTQQSRARP